MTEFTELIRSFLAYFALFAAIALALGALLLYFAYERMRRLDIPQDAGFWETIAITPFIVVLGIDLLDFALDIFALPFTWVVLDRMGLRALRNVSSVEAFIPFTQPIPTLTLCWILAKFGVRF